MIEPFPTKKGGAVAEEDRRRGHGSGSACDASVSLVGGKRGGRKEGKGRRATVSRSRMPNLICSEIVNAPDGQRGRRKGN